MTCTNIKVAFLLSSLRFGGGERVALNLAHAFKARGIDVTFLLMRHEGEFLAEATEHFNVVDLRCDRTWKLPAKLAFYLLRERPDALISSFWKLNLCACLVRIACPNVRLLVWEHSPPSRSANSPTWLYAITASILYQLATKVIAVSAGVRDDVASITIGLGRKLVVIFNPIPPPKVVPGKSAEDNAHRIVWVGRFDYPKNPQLMVEAFARLPKGRGYTLTFVGDGPLRTVLEKMVDELGLRNVVHFLGFKPNPYDWMAKADLLVLTSDREGLGNVLVEALHSGLHVLSTDCGAGIHDVLLDNCYGTIVPVGNADALAHAIVDLLNKPRNIALQIEGAQRFMPYRIAAQFLTALGFRFTEPQK